MEEYWWRSVGFVALGGVAAGLIFWLRSILGTRHGEERERPNPFLAPDNNDNPKTDAPKAVEAAVSPEERITRLQNIKPNY